MSIEFFGDVDRNNKGKIAAEIPSWFEEVKIEKLEEEIASKKRMIANGLVTGKSVPREMQKIEKKEQRLKDIRASRPRLNGGEKTSMNNQYCKIKNYIADSIPTHRDNKRGLVDPREELKSWDSFDIPIDEKYAKAANVKFKNGKTTGKGAKKVFKYMGRLLGENENIEKIRKEGHSESYQAMNELTEHILKEKFNGRGKS